MNTYRIRHTTVNCPTCHTGQVTIRVGCAVQGYHVLEGVDQTCACRLRPAGDPDLLAIALRNGVAA